MGELAPIGICTYTRINHLKQTIDSLKKNTLAKESELYIFSDAPAPGDEEKVSRVRDYLKAIDGFKQVHIVNRKTNCVIQNCEGSLKMLLDKYGKAIFMEEDIVTAPGFLQFMNDGLVFFKNSDRIFSLSGYCPPINAHQYISEDFFILRRFCAWGLGIWKDKHDLISKISREDYSSFMKNKKQVKQFIEAGGEDMLPMLKNEADGDINAFDVRAMFCQAKNNQFTVYPSESLTLNIGHDGSGIHCVKNNKFNVNLWQKTNFNFHNSVSTNNNIIKANNKFRKLTFMDKLTLLTQKLGIYHFLTKIIK